MDHVTEGAAYGRRAQRGFTLIELVVALSTTGLLAALCLSLVIEYRASNRVAAATTDMGNLAVGQEALFTTRQGYVPCDDAGCTRKVPGFRLSERVAYSVTVADGGDRAYSVSGRSAIDNDEIFSYESGKMSWRSSEIAAQP